MKEFGYHGADLGSYIKQFYIGTIELYVEASRGKIFAAFANLRDEADEFQQKEFERMGQHFNPDTDDIGSHYEAAHDASISWYIAMSEFRQSVINLSSVGLWHLFEQQLNDFFRYIMRGYQIVGREIRNDYRESRGYIEELLQLKFDEQPNWSKVDELRVVCNTVKHAEGGSAEKLRDVRPDLFNYPGLGDTGAAFRRPVAQPMAGVDVYLSEKDIENYGAALIGFWTATSDTLSARGFHAVPLHT